MQLVIPNFALEAHSLMTGTGVFFEKYKLKKLTTFYGDSV